MDEEKQTTISGTVATGDGSSADGYSPTPVIAMTPLHYRKLIWKLDVRLLPPLFVLWFVSLIDRLNIGSAKIFGLEKDLHMNPKGNDFNVALVIVMAGLLTMEVPSNYLLKRTSPSIVLAGQCFLLAIFTIGQGVITNFTGLKAMRFFIGICEAGMIPGSVYLLAQYYPRYELQWRLSMLMVGNAVSTAFGGLLALAIAGIKSSNGYHPWRWIFIIEGCITAGVTMLVFPFMPDWPQSAKWLTEEEKVVLADRIKQHGIIGKMDTLNAKSIKKILFDWKIYVLGTIACCTTVTVYSVAIFAPTIIKQFEPTYSPRHVQALVAPIFAAATAGCLAAAYASDKLKHRSSFALFGYLLIIIGASILVNQQHVSMNMRYGSLYFLAVGSYISLPMLWTMLVNNVSGSYKTGYAIAMEVALGNFGGIASALVFQGKQAPKFEAGYKTILGMSIAAAVLVVIYTSALVFENKARAAGKRDYRLSGPDADNLGDDHPQFRYGY